MAVTAIPVDKHKTCHSYSCRKLLRSGPKNMHSSSGCAMTSRALGSVAVALKASIPFYSRIQGHCRADAEQRIYMSVSMPGHACARWLHLMLGTD